MPADQRRTACSPRRAGRSSFARAVAALAAEADADGKPQPFAVLKPWLVGEVPVLSQADAAGQLGWSEGAVKVAVHRLRKRFRELVKAEIAQTVDDPAQVQEELRYLVDVLAQSAPAPDGARLGTAATS